MSLSIVILCYNHFELTERCILSVEASDLPDIPMEFLIYDNGSDGGTTFAVSEAMDERWKIVGPRNNEGHIVGQNKAIAACKYDTVLFISNDVILHRECIRTMWAIKEQYVEKPWAQISPMVFNMDWSPQVYGMDWVWPGYGISRKKWKEEWEIPIVPSICYMLNRPFTTANGRGPFDESLKSSHEDVDLGLWAKGYDLINYLAPGAWVRHEANSTLKGSNNTFHEDRQWVIRKHSTGVDRACRLAVTSLVYQVQRLVRRCRGSRRPGNSGT